MAKAAIEMVALTRVIVSGLGWDLIARVVLSSLTELGDKLSLTHATYTEKCPKWSLKKENK